MTVVLQKWLYRGALGLFVYMPFHIFISQWLSTFTGGLDAWKVGKDVVTALLVAALVCLVLYRRKYTRLYLVLLGLSVAYFLLHLLLFAVTDQPAETGLLGTTYNNRLLWFTLIGYSLALLYPGMRLGRTFAKVLIGVAGIVAFIAFLQWVLPKDIMTHFGYSIERGVKPNFFIDDKPDFPRVFSTIRDPNSLAAFLLLPSTLITVALKRYWMTPKRDVLLGLQALIGLTIILTFSRSGWIALFISHGLAISYLFKNRLVTLAKRFVVPVVCIVAALGIGLFVSRDHYFVQNIILHEDENTQQAGSTDLHAQYIQKGIEGVSEDPEGHGPGTAGIVSTRLPNGLLTENYYLQVAYEVGVAGLLLFIGFLVLILRCLWENRADRINVALIASFVGLAAMNMLLHTWSNEAVAASWFMLAGLGLTRQKPEPEVLAPRAKATRRRP